MDPNFAKKKVSHHHEMKSKLGLRVRLEDVHAARQLTAEKYAAEFPNGVPQTGEVYIANVTEWSFKNPPVTVLYVSATPRMMEIFESRAAVKALNAADVPFTATVAIKEMVGQTVRADGEVAAKVLNLIPSKTLASALPWIVKDSRRYLLLVPVSRAALRKHADSVLKSADSQSVVMTDDAELALQLKLKYGGTLYDMEEIRA